MTVTISVADLERLHAQAPPAESWDSFYLDYASDSRELILTAVSALPALIVAAKALRQARALAAGSGNVGVPLAIDEALAAFSFEEQA